MKRRRSFKYIQTFHTHTHILPEAGWFACNEVKMRMKRGMKMR